MTDLIAALALNALLGLGAYMKKSVSISGLAAGLAVGTVIYFYGGPEAWTVMGAFFVSSSMASKFKKKEKNSLSHLWEKGDRRDYLQVLANGGIGCAAVIAHRLTGDPVYVTLFAASFASSNADTWASEIGTLSQTSPRSIITFRPVPRGTSGGVSVLGFVASLSGAAFIAAVHVAATQVFRGSAAHLYGALPFIILGGLAGSVIDSIMGATVQGQYHCAETGGLTEKRTVNGVPTKLVKGFSLVNNDMVNFLSTLAAVSLVLLIARWSAAP